MLFGQNTGKSTFLEPDAPPARRSFRKVHGMRQAIASTLQVIGLTAGILATVLWGSTCWSYLAQQDVNATSQEIRWDFRMLGLALVSLPIVGFLVYGPFAWLADRIAPPEPRDVS
jgi:hypothetical protein